jgi:hypothetical protein
MYMHRRVSYRYRGLVMLSVIHSSFGTPSHCNLVFGGIQNMAFTDVDVPIVDRLL